MVSPCGRQRKTPSLARRFHARGKRDRRRNPYDNGAIMRPSKRAPDEMRQVSFERGVARYAEGSCLVKFGNTQVLCAAPPEAKPPRWLRAQGRGWVTAEYSMLPRATHTRTRREAAAGRLSGRTQEIPSLTG